MRRHHLALGFTHYLLVSLSLVLFIASVPKGLRAARENGFNLTGLECLVLPCEEGKALLQVDTVGRARSTLAAATMALRTGDLSAANRLFHSVSGESGMRPRTELMQAHVLRRVLQSGIEPQCCLREWHPSWMAELAPHI